MKNFAANNIIQVAGVSHVLGSVQRGNHRLEILCIKEKKTTTRSSPIRYWNEGSTVGWYFRIRKG